MKSLASWLVTTALASTGVLAACEINSVPPASSPTGQVTSAPTGMQAAPPPPDTHPTATGGAPTVTPTVTPTVPPTVTPTATTATAPPTASAPPSAHPTPTGKPTPSAVLPWNGPKGTPSAGPPGLTP